MNIVLSLLVCLAMLFGGMETVPQTPKTMHGFRLVDINWQIGNKQVEFTPELQLRIGTGTEEASVDLSVHMRNKQVLPYI